MEIAIKVIQLILALSILVFVHELGHFIFARLFGIRVEKFYLFFDYKFAIFRFKPKNSETEYGIGWLPFGGYCKISGMIDESMDTEAMKSDPKPWEFRSKPAWQRLLVLFGGVLFNFILACLIFSFSFMTWGEKYISTDNAKYGICASELAQEIGFRHGDRILEIEGRPTDDFSKMQIEMIRSQAGHVRVLRDGDTTTVTVDSKYIPAMLNTQGMFSLSIPCVISSIPENSPNIASGIMAGDRILSVEGEELKGGVFQMHRILEDCKGKNVGMTILRGTDSLAVSPYVDTLGHINVMLESDITRFMEVTERRYGFISGLSAGFRRGATAIADYIEELKLIFRPETEAYKSVGSFITIGSIFPSMWNWQIFWNITAALSTMLAVLNVLPIPALDGGHILFTLYEIVTRRKPSDRFLEYAQIAGIIILFGLMILALGNDITRLFR